MVHAANYCRSVDVVDVAYVAVSETVYRPMAERDAGGVLRPNDDTAVPVPAEAAGPPQPSATRAAVVAALQGG